MKTTVRFKTPQESKRWIAQQNENHFFFEAAARIYREIGDEESAKRCERSTTPTSKDE